MGRFEGDVFDPIKWRPEYPNPAFDNMRADDAFWAARLVARFSNDAIRAVVAKGRYIEPGAADHIATTLIKRRDKVLRAWLTAVNPLADARLGSDGVLVFENAAVSARVTSAASRYTLTWSRFDNATNATTGTPVETTATETRATAPPAILERRTIRNRGHPNHPSRLPSMGYAGYVYVPAGVKRVADGGRRSDGSTTGTALISDQNPPLGVILVTTDGGPAIC